MDAQLADTIAETPIEYFFSGAFGGLLGTLIGHPFDTVKVRMHTLPRTKGRPTTYAVLQHILSREGVAGLYKGIWTPLLAILPSYALSFAGYKTGKMLFGPGEHVYFTHHHYFLAGCFSGLWCGLVLVPGDRIKCVLQVQQQHKPHTRKYDGVMDAAAKLYRAGGIRNIFRGTGVSLMKEIPAGGVYFSTYEVLRDALTNHAREPTGVVVAMMSGGTAGLAYALTVAPLDVLRSRVMSAEDGKYPRGMRDALPDLWRHEGVHGFTRGLTPILLRAFPANAACFLGFEMMRGYIRMMADSNVDYSDYPGSDIGP